jgi:hypothetical protein
VKLRSFSKLTDCGHIFPKVKGIIKKLWIMGLPADCCEVQGPFLRSWTGHIFFESLGSFVNIPWTEGLIFAK